MILLGVAVKLVMTGLGSTVTVTTWELWLCPAPVMVKVKVRVVVRFPVDSGLPLRMVPNPWSTFPDPPENTAVRVVAVPAVMGVFAAVKLTMVGSGAGEEPQAAKVSSHGIDRKNVAGSTAARDRSHAIRSPKKDALARAELVCAAESAKCVPPGHSIETTGNSHIFRQEYPALWRPESTAQKITDQRKQS